MIFYNKILEIKKKARELGINAFILLKKEIGYFIPKPPQSSICRNCKHQLSSIYNLRAFNCHQLGLSDHEDAEIKLEASCRFWRLR